MRALARLIRAAVARRRLQSLVVGMVALLSTGTVVLAVSLLVASDAPFDHAFGRQAGAHATASFEPALAGTDALRATAGRPGVTAAAGPFDAAGVRVSAGPLQLGTMTAVGRADPGGPVDRLSVDDGGWLTGPGQIVLSDQAGKGPGTRVGDTLTVAGTSLRVVGVARSVTHTADAWVWPTQRDVLHAGGTEATRQMLYRFASAGTDASTAASLSAATAGLPRGALLGSASYLAAKRAADSSTAPVVPFVVAFALLGLVMSVLVVANVVNGAVVSGYRTIGVLKTLGFSPPQVVAVYAGQIVVPGLAGCLGGAVLGNLLAVPVLAQTERAYEVAGPGGVAGWVDLLAVLGMPAVLVLAAVAPAVRAGRLPAAQVISVGRAPRTGRGYRVRRALAATRLPLPVRFGLATPFARPARTAVTVLAVLLGAVTVVFAVGLSTSLHRVAAAATRADQVPVEVDLGIGGIRKGGGIPVRHEGDPAAVAAAIRTQPGTAHVAAVTTGKLTLVGYTDPVSMEAYDPDGSWLGFPLIAGRWYTGPDEVVAASGLLRTTGHRVGDTVTLAGDRERRQARVVGEVFDLNWDGMVLLGGPGSLTGRTDEVTPTRFAVGLTPGTDPDGYANALSRRLGTDAAVSVSRDRSNSQTFAILQSLIATLTVLLAVVAGLGVVNTVVLNTRERAYEIGVLKTLGMTPRQVRATVVTSMAGIGLLAGILATPLGDLLHHRILPIMADAAGTRLPPSFIHVYRPLELVGLGAAGLVLATAGALIPAGWAAHTRIATALRAE
jgi:putative ABC transport system permease protein